MCVIMYILCVRKVRILDKSHKDAKWQSRVWTQTVWYQQNWQLATTSYSLKSVTLKRWKVLFGLFLAEELYYARPGYGFNFFVYPYEKRYDNWWCYNGLFSGFWKIPWISVRDTHDVCCLHSICPVCCMAEGLSILDRIVLPEVSTRGDFVSQGTFGNSWSHFRLSRLVWWVATGI